MLVYVFSVIALAVTALLCGLTGPSLAWLYQLPLSFLGTFVLLAAAWFVMMVIMAKTVDMEKDYDKESPFFRWVVKLIVPALVTLLRVRIHTRGMEQAPKSGRFLLVCNHLHDTDPVVLFHAFPNSQLAFISKRENDVKFLVGPFLRKLLCQPINRENDREALKTILKCVQLIKNDEVSIAVFPEGYVSLDKKLHPFRGGVFKIAQKAQVPIVVCTLQNTQYIYDSIKALKPCDVQLHLVGVIQPEQLQGRTAVDIAQQVHAMMAEDLGPELVLQENT